MAQDSNADTLNNKSMIYVISDNAKDMRRRYEKKDTSAPFVTWRGSLYILTSSSC